MIDDTGIKRDPWPKEKKRMMAKEKERGGRRKRSMVHGEKKQGEKEKEMVRERVCEKDGKGKRAMTEGKKVRKRGESNGMGEKAQSPGRE